jgi:hypothetical protein
MFAARIKNGMASSGKLSKPANTLCGRIDSGIEVVTAKTKNDVPVSTTNMGKLKPRPTRSNEKVSKIVVVTLIFHGCFIWTGKNIFVARRTEEYLNNPQTH